MLAATLADVKPRNFVAKTNEWFTFETALGRGVGHMRFRDKGKHCWTLLTTLQELKGHEEKAGPNRVKLPPAADDGGLGIARQPYVLIVGGGQGGIALAARLKRLQVPALVVEKNERAGDSWRKRYQSLCLHDPVWYDHMPYLPFPDHWPVFSPKDRIADWLEMYVKVMQLDYWTSTLCKRARFNEAADEWEVLVMRDGQPHTLRPAHLVLATGMSGFPTCSGDFRRGVLRREAWFIRASTAAARTGKASTASSSARALPATTSAPTSRSRAPSR